MKLTTIVLIPVVLIAAFVLSGCDSPSKKMEKAETSVIEAKRDLEIATSEVEAELSLYRAENADRIMEYNRTISGIKKKIENESDKEVKEKLKMKLDEYETTHNDLKREINNYKASGKESWDDFKDSFSSRMDDLGNSLDNFFSTTGATSSIN
jgi:F0F1-type ATP synthase membrane subunit b/b'